MGAKNISISDEAYSRLLSHKRPKESFTDVVNRLTEKKSILEIAGLLTKPESREILSQIHRLRKTSARRIAITSKKMK
ncbi:MAG: antitoxin VapB family protein [Nitrososphaerales archaeon]